MFPKTFVAVLVFVSCISIYSQTEPQPSPTPVPAVKLREDAIDLLKDTTADVNNLRSLPNRIGFSAELASLMWLHDERQARAMFGGVMSDYRELLARYSADLAAASLAPQPGAAAGETTDRTLAERRMRTAISVGQQITSTLAENDPELAFNFYFDSIAAITDPAIRQKIDLQSSYFETQLLSRIAQKNPAKAVPLAVRSLRDGFGYQHMELLRSLYGKDPAAAAAFGEAIVSSLKMIKPGSESLWAASSLITFGSETLADSKKPGGKRPVFTESQLADISNSVAEAILDLKDNDIGMAGEFAAQIEAYAPARAAQVRARFGIKKSAPRPATRDLPTIAGADTDAQEAATLSLQTAKQADDREKQMYADVSSKLTKELPAEERQRVIEEARKIIAETPGRAKKVTALCFLAARVKQAGDHELAKGILKDAASFVNPDPKNYEEFLLTWTLASGYATADPDMAFSLLGDTIPRANDTINAFVKVGEFIDTTGEIVDDGEVQVGSFGGNMVRGITSELGLASITVFTLARADFAKTRDLANRFDRPEVRVLAKLLIIRSVLGTGASKPPEQENKSAIEQ